MNPDNNDLQFDDISQPNAYITISSFDQIMMHTIKLGELLTAYHKSLKINDKDLKHALILNYQAMLVNLGIFTIGQQVEYDDDSLDDDALDKPDDYDNEQ